ncbi:MAG TPA: hypothetical protein PLD25_32100 [Chloroflexota bacterium]|nr:hypothetical protein [Chloroflexota bacterium]HUM72030.1 hypothetical protein [Chloroflexota bacterium]
MAKYLFPLFLLMLPALACQAGTTASSSASAAARGQAFVFYKGQAFFWIDSRTGERQVLMGSNRLENLDAALSQPHFLADNLAINSDGRLYSFDRRDGVVAPTGHRLAYVAEDGLHTQYINGAEDVLIAANGRAPVWRGDGQLLAFQQENNLMVASLTGENQRQLLSDQSPLPLAWSPDGERLLYQDGTTLAIVPVTGGEPSVVPIDATILTLAPQWTADGHALIAGYPGEKGTKLVLIELADGHRRDLIVWDKESGIGGFAVSPTDGRIAFWAETCRRRQSDLFPSTYEECGYRVHVADGNGGNIRQLDTNYVYLNVPVPPLGWAVTLLSPVNLPSPPVVTATPLVAEQPATLPTAPPMIVPGATRP